MDEASKKALAEEEVKLADAEAALQSTTSALNAEYLKMVLDTPTALPGQHYTQTRNLEFPRHIQVITLINLC